MTPPVLALFVAVLMVAIRVPLFDALSGDYTGFVARWYTQIKSNGGFAALRDTSFSNYNVPYLYLLAAVTYLPVPQIVAIKSISVVFDLVMAFFAYRIVGLRRPGRAQVIAVLAVLVAPTVVLNGADWAQCDSIYTAFLLGSLYFLLRRKPIWASVFFGLAFAFKLQAIFFLPILAIVLIVQRERLRRIALAVVVAPLVFAAMLLPALLAGNSLSELLAVYPAQVSSGGVGAGTRAVGGQAAGGFGGAGAGRAFGGGGGATSSYRGGLVYNAPSFYQWLPATAASGWRSVGLAATALAIGAAAVVAWLRRRFVTDARLMLLASTLLIAIPFLLPGMHERYFYAADVFTIVTCFFVRRFIPVAVIVQLCSLFSYIPYLWQTTVLPWGVLAAGEAVALIWSAVLLILALRRPVPPDSRTALTSTALTTTATATA